MRKGATRNGLATAIPKYLSLTAILISSILFVHDRAELYKAEKEKESLKILAKERALEITEHVDTLDHKVRDWMKEHELSKFSNLTRSELRKVHWTSEVGGMIQEMRRAAIGEEAGGSSRLDQIKPLPGQKCVWRGCENPTQLTDQLIKNLEDEKRKRIAAAVSGKPVPKQGSASIGDLEQKMPDRIRIKGPTTDFSGNHPILALPQEKYSATSVSALVEGIYAPPMTGQSDGGAGKTCDGDFGIELMKRWRDLKAEFCSPLGQPSPKVGAPNKVSGSKIDCYVIQQTGHSGSDNMCSLENVVLDMAPYSNKDLTKKTMEDYKKTKHEDQAYMHFSQPVITGLCSVVGDKFNNEKLFPGWNKDWLWNGFKAVKDEGSRELACDVWEETPSMIVERDTFANMYHDTEDFWNVFLTMGILQLARDNTQILLADLYPWGPFKAIWTEAFGGKPPLTAWDMREKWGAKKVCFRNLIMGIYGPASSLTIMKKETKCVGSPLVRAYSDYVIRGLNMQAFTHAALAKPPTSVLVNYMARRSSVIWPERAFCDDRFFVCSEWSHLENRKLGRVVKNDKEVVAALQEMQSATFSGGRTMVFVDMDYNLLSFQDQLKTDCMTDVMIGPHGAGLTHQMFMPDRAVLIELFVDNSGANKHFHNMARWRGRGGNKYRPVSTQNPVNIDKIKDIVREAVNSIDITQY
mmetsp:Transcript_42238/g.99129  ORF Transcript_42238/g.99129 Transcript_42238/m.99129 type:complete len:693 (+) Transcript_42238:150-2228(+)